MIVLMLFRFGELILLKCGHHLQQESRGEFPATHPVAAPAGRTGRSHAGGLVAPPGAAAAPVSAAAGQPSP